MRQGRRKNEFESGAYTLVCEHFKRIFPKRLPINRGYARSLLSNNGLMMPTILFEKLLTNSIVLTVNSRLSRYLMGTYDNHQRACGKSVWETPRILPLSSWLEKQFHQINISGAILLNAFQEHCVWKNIIQTSANKTPLLQLGPTAKLAQDAYELLTLWQISL